MFECFHNPPNSDMDYRIFNVRIYVDARVCIRGCTDTVRESALKVDPWSKIPCRTGESNLRQRHAGPMLHQVSYIPSPTLKTMNAGKERGEGGREALGNKERERKFDLIIIIINPLTARVVGAPQLILQPVFSIFPCSPQPSGTCRTPGLSIPWCCLPTSSFVRLVFFPLSLCLARWFWPDLMNGKHDHTTAVCVFLQFYSRGTLLYNQQVDQ